MITASVMKALRSIYNSFILELWYQHRNNTNNTELFKKQRFRSVLRKRCPENMQQIYRSAPMPKCDFIEISKCNFIEITLRHGCCSIHLLHIFRTLFYKNTSGGPLLLFLKTAFKESVNNGS